MNGIDQLGAEELRALLLGLLRELDAEAANLAARAEAIEGEYQRIAGLLEHVDALPPSPTRGPVSPARKRRPARRGTRRKR